MYIDIYPLLKEKEMTRHDLSRKLNVTYPTITAIYECSSTSIKFDILENICTVLECTPNDILKFGKPNLDYRNPITDNEKIVPPSPDFMNLPK
jgi:putative transcriptional regulator